ncbi:MAG: PAS-domain containing protein [Pseudomonadota bacterium]
MNEPAVISRLRTYPGVSDIGLADFLETLHDGVAVIGRDMRIKYLNERLLDMLGLQAADWAAGTELRNLFFDLAPRGLMGPLNGRPIENFIDERMRAFGSEESRVERRLLPDGRVWDIYRTPTDNEDIISIHVDVTEQVRSAEEVEKQRQYMISLLDNTTDGIGLLDKNGCFVMFNDRLLELYDIDPSSVHWGITYRDLARHFGDLRDLTEAERSVEIERRYRFAFDPRAQDVRRKLSDGRTLNVKKRLLPDGGCVMTYRDITEELRREQELIEARNEAEESSRHKSEFVARMSHEMRTPLNGVLGVAALLQRTEMGDRERELLDVISNSGKVLLRLIDDILDLSRIDADAVEVVEEDFHIDWAIEECVRLIQPAANDKALAVEIVRPSQKIPQLRGDVVRIKQILLNLLTNAVKFTSRGCIEVTQEYEESGNDVTVTLGVSDTGVGIAEAELGQIFNRFYQIDGTATRKFGGAGLGLAITQKIVDAMGGAIQVESEIGKGTTFRVRLTFARASSKA